MQGSVDTHPLTPPPAEAEALTPANKQLILITAVIQGLALYGLKYWSAVEDWSPVWQYLCYTLAVAIPPLIIVSVAPRLAPGYWWVVGGYAALLALLSSYRGYQCTPADLVYCEPPTAFVAAIGIATFIVAFLLRASATDTVHLKRPDYPALFHYSWDNALTIALTLIFTGIFWLILFLWQALFHLVGVDFFQQLFDKDWFIYPVTGFVAGCGAVLLRSQQSFVLTLKRLLRTMLVALLPLLAVLTIVFLATLPFTGLQPIWDTGHGSALLLWLVALLLFFTNGVIQDEFPFARYPRWINWVLLLALVVTPFYTAFALYGVNLRVQQYGWTPERLWGLVVALTLALLAASYSLAILYRRGHWAEWLRRINTGLALWVLAVCLLTQSPLLNFWRISAHSQVERLQAGRIELAEFDFSFLHRKLGQPGLEALQTLQALPKVQQSAPLVEYLEKLVQSNERDWNLQKNPLKPETSQQTLQQIEVLPSSSKLPKGFGHRRIEHACGDPEESCLLLARDLDGNGTPDYLLFAYRTRSDHKGWLQVTAFAQVDGQWQPVSSNGRETEEPFATLRERLTRDKTELRPARWQALYLNGELLFDPTE